MGCLSTLFGCFRRGKEPYPRNTQRPGRSLNTRHTLNTGNRQTARFRPGQNQYLPDRCKAELEGQAPGTPYSPERQNRTTMGYAAAAARSSSASAQSALSAPTVLHTRQVQRLPAGVPRSSPGRVIPADDDEERHNRRGAGRTRPNNSTTNTMDPAVAKAIYVCGGQLPAGVPVPPGQHNARQIIFTPDIAAAVIQHGGKLPAGVAAPRGFASGSGPAVPSQRRRQGRGADY